MLKIFMLPADDGDCFVLEFDNEIIIIDCGTRNTYHSQLKPLLISFSKIEKHIRLLIITHIDRDHIEGAIEFLKDIKQDRYINIDEIWFNGYLHILPNDIVNSNITESERRILERYLYGYQYNFTRDNEAISAKQGMTFTKLIIETGIKWNSSFERNPIVKGLKINILSDVCIEIISPCTTALTNMFTQWVKELNTQKYNFRAFNSEIVSDAFELYMANGYCLDTVVNLPVSNKSFVFENLVKSEYFPDTSLTNKSSIAFELTYKEKRFLFLGDIEGQAICDYYSAHQHFEIIKVAHHGSARNNPLGLYKLIHSPVYLGKR